jgi:hypothetical protein
MTDGPGTDLIEDLLRQTATDIENNTAVPDVSVVKRGDRGRRRQLVVATTAAAVVALGLIAANIGSGGSNGPGHTKQTTSLAEGEHVVHFAGNQLVVKDLKVVSARAAAIPTSAIRTNNLALSAPTPSSITFGDGSAWALGAGTATGCGRVLQINETSDEVTNSLALPLCPEALSFTNGALWVLSFQISVPGYTITRIDPNTLATAQNLVIDGGPDGTVQQGYTVAKALFLAAGGNQLVAAVQDPVGTSQIVGIDSVAGVVTWTAPLPTTAGTVSGLGVTGDAVWVGTSGGFVYRLDPMSGTVLGSRHLGTRVASLSAVGNEVWVSVNLPVPASATYPGLDVLRLDPMTGAIADDTGLAMAIVATDGQSVWAVSSAPPDEFDNGLVAKLDPTTGAIEQRASLPTTGYATPDALSVIGGSGWVINSIEGTLSTLSP